MDRRTHMNKPIKTHKQVSRGEYSDGKGGVRVSPAALIIDECVEVKARCTMFSHHNQNDNGANKEEYMTNSSD